MSSSDAKKVGLYSSWNDCMSTKGEYKRKVAAFRNWITGEFFYLYL